MPTRFDEIYGRIDDGSYTQKDVWYVRKLYHSHQKLLAAAKMALQHGETASSESRTNQLAEAVADADKV